MHKCRTCGKDLASQGRNRKARYCNIVCANKYYYKGTGYQPVPKDQRKQREPVPGISELARRRKNEVWHKYKLDWEEYQAFYETQGGACALCRRPLAFCKEDTSKEVAHVDHCHSTGKVRGLLCSKCNKGLGHFFDNPTTLRLAAEYLERARSC
jgi:hypothetical protein